MRRASCPRCGTATPKRARFCPECGSRIGGGDGSTAVIPPPPAETGPVPVERAAAEPRLFGVAPPTILVVLGVAAVAAGVVLLATGRTLPGGLALAAGILLLAAFAEVARRKPDGAVARVSAGALGAVRARAGYAADVVATRSRAGRELARARQELLALAGERERRLRELGEAVYGDDRKGSKRLRSELAELDARIERKEAEMSTIAAEARERLERARLEVQPTEAHTPLSDDSTRTGSAAQTDARGDPARPEDGTASGAVEVPEPPRPSPDPDPLPTPEPPTPVPEPGPTPVPERGPTPVPEPYPPPDEATPPQPARIPEPGPLDDAREKK